MNDIKMNWFLAGLSWYDKYDFNVSDVLIKIDKDLTFEEISSFYEDGYYMAKEFRNIPITLEEIENHIESLSKCKLYKIYTLQEAAELWGLKETTVRQWCNRAKFTDKEARKSAGTWLISRKGMERVAGKLN